MLETHENISYTNAQRSFKGGRTGSYYVSKHPNIFLLRRAAPAASCADRTSLRTRTTRSYAVLQSPAPFYDRFIGACLAAPFVFYCRAIHVGLAVVHIQVDLCFGIVYNVCMCVGMFYVLSVLVTYLLSLGVFYVV